MALDRRLVEGWWSYRRSVELSNSLLKAGHADDAESMLSQARRDWVSVVNEVHPGAKQIWLLGGSFKIDGVYMFELN